MGSYEDLAFTFSPARMTAEEVAHELRELLDRSLDDLPDGNWDRTNDRYRDHHFERDALQIEVDDEYGQTYLFGRTHASPCQQAWREWVVNGGIGDGTLAIVLHHEVDYWGWGWVYEWNDSAGEYEPAVSDSEDAHFHVEGEKCGFGAIAAHRIHDLLEIRPARCRGQLVRWGESGWDDDDFIPEFYFESRDDPPDPRTD